MPLMPLQFLQMVQLNEAETSSHDIEELMRLAFVDDEPSSPGDAEFRAWIRQALRIAYGHGFQRGEENLRRRVRCVPFAWIEED